MLVTLLKLLKALGEYQSKVLGGECKIWWIGLKITQRWEREKQTVVVCLVGVGVLFYAVALAFACYGGKNVPKVAPEVQILKHFGVYLGKFYGSRHINIVYLR